MTMNKNTVPEHIAIIMDGNGRWAKERGEERLVGHQYGIESVRKAINGAIKNEIKYLTLYTFSTENWNRPKEEIDGLMEIMVDAIIRETPELLEKGISLETIGAVEMLPENVREKLNKCIKDTSKGENLKLILALSYSGKWDILNATKKIAKLIENKEINFEHITEELFSQNLTTNKYPNPDLMIRTSGERRISNFLLWELAYSEFYFTEKYWPDFDEKELEKAIFDYQNRERRFGKTGNQIK